MRQWYGPGVSSYGPTQDRDSWRTGLPPVPLTIQTIGTAAQDDDGCREEGQPNRVFVETGQSAAGGLNATCNGQRIHRIEDSESHSRPRGRPLASTKNAVAAGIRARTPGQIPENSRRDSGVSDHGRNRTMTRPAATARRPMSNGAKRLIRSLPPRIGLARMSEGPEGVEREAVAKTAWLTRAGTAITSCSGELPRACVR